MKFIILIIFSITLQATNIQKNEFFSIVYPLEQYIIKSATNGKIVYVNDKIEGNFANNSIIVEIDKELDTIELEQLKIKSKIINNMIGIENKNYNIIKNISSKSKFDKDNQKLKLLNLESLKIDLKIKLASLKDKISNKTLKETNNYIYNISIKKGDYVNLGSVLYEVHDLSKGKLEIFIPINFSKDILNKTIYINNKKTKYKINKIYKVADKKHISRYRCEIIINKPKDFSKLYKIQFK
jgi:hypothetical protein